jgi:hypothetical protein
MVAAGFSLRFSPSDGCMRVSRKLRNLKDAATRPNVQFGTGGHKSLNLGYRFSCKIFDPVLVLETVNREEVKLWLFM